MKQPWKYTTDILQHQVRWWYWQFLSISIYTLSHLSGLMEDVVWKSSQKDFPRKLFAWKSQTFSDDEPSNRLNVVAVPPCFAFYTMVEISPLNPTSPKKIIDTLPSDIPPAPSSFTTSPNSIRCFQRTCEKICEPPMQEAMLYKGANDGKSNSAFWN